MGYLRNEKGIALVTALMFTALALVIALSLLAFVTTGIQTSAALKRYRTALDATYGGSEIMLKDAVNAAFAFHDYSSSSNNFSAYMKSSLGTLSSTATFSGCLRQRMTLPTSKWSGACANPTMNASSNPDISFELGSVSGTPFVVYSKIVDTMERRFLVYDGGSKTVVIAGNSDTSSYSLEGGSTTEGGGVTVPHYPYIYRMEVLGQRKENPLEKARISVQYAY
jgi:hypothetical protein